MRIVFIGTVEFSLHALECLLAMNAEIVGVCTLQESKFNADHVDLSAVSAAHGIPWLYVEDVNSEETLGWIQDKSPDVIFCFGWPRLLKQDLLRLTPLGVIGFHPTALPANRGRHPLIWTLVLGLEKTASTFFFMDAEADSGDILSQREIIIDHEDDARILYNKTIKSALEQIEEFVPQLAAGAFQRRKQDRLLANTWRKRGHADGEIDWRMSAHSIHNLVRGLAKPYIGAHFIVDGQEIKVWKTVVVRDVPSNIEPGKVLNQTGSNFVIKCGEDAICLLNTEPLFEPIVGGYL
ncbi:MAG: formyltransferase family protein [Anaerolineaceae bacterium]|nr:formyl transferase [Betaproteobacteria bacterium]